MGQSGKLTFFLLHALADPKQTIGSVVRYLRPQCMTVVTRGVSRATSWEDFRLDRDEPDDELLPRIDGAEGLERYYVEGQVLAGQLDGSPVGLSIGRAVEARIPLAVRGDYAPWDPVVVAGWHDLWECAEHDDGFYIGRAFLSVAFFGYSSPRDWKGFRRMIFELPEVQQTRNDLEQVIGHPLESAIYWST